MVEKVIPLCCKMAQRHGITNIYEVVSNKSIAACSIYSIVTLNAGMEFAVDLIYPTVSAEV